MSPCIWYYKLPVQVTQVNDIVGTRGRGDKEPNSTHLISWNKNPHLR